MIILGINIFHADSSACILIDGQLVAAVEEERFRRIKHWSGFPSESINYCLSEAGVDIGQVDHLAINQSSKANLWEKISFTLGNRPDANLILDRIRNKRKRVDILEYLSLLFPKGEKFRGKIHKIEHHLAHMASAFYVSPFEQATVLSVDGVGDFVSTAWGNGQGTELFVKDRIFFPHSLGIFYQAMTQWLGFPHYGDEYKVMGLSSYGKPSYTNEMEKIVNIQENGHFTLNLDFFRHHVETVGYEWEDGQPKVGRLFSGSLTEFLGPAREEGGELKQKHKDIACSVQTMYEKAIFNLLNSIHSDSECLAIAGGCAMNSVANGKIPKKTPFRKTYIQAAAGDAGGAMGAALSVWYKLGSIDRSFEMKHAYFGPEFSSSGIRKLIDEYYDKFSQLKCEVRHYSDEYDLCYTIATAITEGKIVGWFQGRMEWGPRALGNRSILGDPRRKDMKEILNSKIKRRESFRPFAPSILKECVSEWFEYEDEVPFMMKVYPIRQDKRSIIPAVTHVDGSGRLQTVSRESNSRFYHLIEEFNKITGVPILLNTSFNENEPIVCSPHEAISCFLRTEMDALVLEDWVILRT